MPVSRPSPSISAARLSRGIRQLVRLVTGDRAMPNAAAGGERPGQPAARQSARSRSSESPPVRLAGTTRLIGRRSASDLRAWARSETPGAPR